MTKLEIIFMIFLPLHFLINGVLLGYQISVNDISVNTTKQKITGILLLLFVGWFWFLLLTIYYLIRNLLRNDYIFLTKALIGINKKKVKDMIPMGLYEEMQYKMKGSNRFYTYLCERVITKYNLNENNSSK